MSEVRHLDVRAPLKVVRGNRHSGCPHNHVTIDDRTRKLECEDCQEDVDPVQFLIEWADRLRLVRYSPEQIEILEARYRDLERKTDEKRRERDRLTREIRKLRKEAGVA